MEKLYYATQHKDIDILNKSGSGGMFYALSKHILDKNGIVYGASFVNDFKDVEIVRCDNIANLDILLQSKYMMSSAKESFSLVKEDLEAGKLVLYSGLPCQIHTLRHFLDRDYDNLICVELVCHGTLSANIWKDYLQSVVPMNKKIISVNMRDKRFGWNDYGMSIKFDDDTEFFEKHQDNKFMKLFLSDKYLNTSCYDCKFKNDFSKADLVIGDFWGANATNIPLEKRPGINLVVINTSIGLQLFNELDEIKKVKINKEASLRFNGGMQNKIKTIPETYNKCTFMKNNKVGILTLNFNDNIGGVLQSYALQKFLNNNYYDATTIQSHDYWHKLSFVKKLKTKTVTDFSRIKSDFDSYIVGSDQVWRREFISGKWAESWKTWRPLFLDFAKNWNVNRIAYSASYGTNHFDFDDVINEVKTYLDSFDAISMREIDATEHVNTLTKNEVVTTCDPTMLLDKEEYLSLCKDINKKENGLFSYILDKDTTKNTIKETIKSSLNISDVKRQPNNVEDWLACYRDCKCVLTDSFHGVVFSIIFNKPFICVLNKGRGESRFNTLIELFNIKDRVVTKEEDVNLELLTKEPNIDLQEIVEFSKDFLLKNLEKKEIKQTKTSPVFGIISWFPDKEPERTQRINRLNRMLGQLTDLFGSDIHFLITAQNWKDYKLPESVKNVTVHRHNKLGIIGARKMLGKHFLDSAYDYLIMCDDDIVLETSDKFTREYFFDMLNRHADGFFFLKYGWSLTFCGVSKYIYAQSPMVDIDPEKEEGYEDVVYPNLLHYKYPDKEFKLEGIMFVQHQAQYVKELKSTWCDKTTNHAKLDMVSKYHVNQFKKGNFIIDKESAKKFAEKYEWYQKAIFYGWCSREEYNNFMKGQY